MDEWKRVINWAVQQQREEGRKEREHFRRTCRAWPIIAVATIPFGWLAFMALDPVLATFCTAAVLITSVLVAEHHTSI